MGISSFHGLRVMLAALSVPAAGSAQAIACDELRAAVEAKIQANGVKQFSIKVVDAQATGAGQVVGTCELGSRKLVYTSGAAPKAEASPPAKPAVITECADGRVMAQGSCKK